MAHRDLETAASKEEYTVKLFLHVLFASPRGVKTADIDADMHHSTKYRALQTLADADLLAQDGDRWVPGPAATELVLRLIEDDGARVLQGHLEKHIEDQRQHSKEAAQVLAALGKA